MTIKIVAAILDTHQLVLYKEDGEAIEIPQGDVRVKRIIEEVTIPLSTLGYAHIEVGYAEDQQNHYKEFEESTSGVVRLFRVAKKFVKNLFNPATDAEPVNPVALGQVPTPVVAATVAESGDLVPVADVNDPALVKPVNTKAASVPEKIQDATKNQKPTINSAVDQIMANAKSVSAPEFNSSDHNSEEDTIIAVVDTPTGPSIIPGVENLSNQMRVAAKLGSTIGVQNFLTRLGAVINDRGHSVQELLNFMSRGDLPIADDGSIIGYKVLRSTRKDSYVAEGDDPMPVPPTGYYVDCHSGRVLQRVGSYVSQKNVDPSRRTQCSTGLHIARRAYLRGFSGDIITLVKIAPEDVIAVPENEPDKMRAQGYHIIAEIPREEHDRLRANQPIEGMMAKRMLGMAIKGQHIGIIEDVIIGGDKGRGLEVVPRKGHGAQVAPKVTEKAPVAEALPDPEKKIGYESVDAKAISEAVISTKTATPTPAPVAPPTRAERINHLIDVLRGNDTGNKKVDAARELIQIGKTAKKSLSKLGVSDANVSLVNQWAQQEPAAKPVEKAAPVVTSTKEAAKKKTAAQAEKPKPKESKKAAVHEASKATVTQKEVTPQRHLFNRGEFAQLWALKKTKKKSWEALGFNPSEEKRIFDNAPKK